MVTKKTLVKKSVGPCMDSACQDNRNRLAEERKRYDETCERLMKARNELRVQVTELRHELVYLQQTIRSLHWSLGTALDYVRAYQQQYGLHAKFKLEFAGDAEQTNQKEYVGLAE